ncbi:ArgK/MeaB family GTPase [Coprothermobacter platensis]|uniref:ArgK/MeaB family GTPase n=1 Tax=Coprothermobacter platensis TaxID=108819 RepID=UPI000361AADC|nr:GTP-binding protein [Coprothermobacter platensis]
MGKYNALINGVKKGSQAAIAQSISIIEKNDDDRLELIKALYSEESCNTPLIGLTGFGGAGKSSLVGALAEVLLKQDKKVGIMAVDPTSPKSGGSLLGDRIRLQYLFPNNKLFFRSFANKGALGGLSPILMESVKVLEVAGFNYIFLETVGIGQSEVDITHFADVVVLVMSPGLGDEIQFLKGGIMEIADVLVMNKMDMPNANISLAALEAYSRLLDQPPTVVPVSVIARQNIDLLLKTIDEVYENKRSTGYVEKLRMERSNALYQAWVMQMLRPIVDQRYTSEEIPYVAAKSIADRMRRCIDDR